MKLSLIISTYNRAESLLRTLESVAAQTAMPKTWECIVVNNNSTDDTAARFAAFAAAHPQFFDISGDIFRYHVSRIRLR